MKSFLKWITSKERQLNNSLPELAYGFGSDITAMVANRVTQKGIAYDNKPFTPYSTNPLPSFYFRGKGRTAQARKAAQSTRSLSYKMFRQLSNLNTDKKEFSYTGEMWKDYGVLNTTSKGAKFSVVVGLSKKHEFKAIFGSAREGKNILRPSKKEIEIASSSMVEKIKQILE